MATPADPARQEPSAGASGHERHGILALGVVSAVALGQEVFLTRLLAYTVQAPLLYVVLGVALLGFGAAGSLVAVRPRWLAAENIDRTLAWAALGLPVGLVAGTAAFVRLARHLPYSIGPVSFAVAGVLTLPFLAAGVVIALALSCERERIGRRYAANLAGSALGCFLTPLLLGPLDAQHHLAFLAALGWVGALVYVRRTPARWRSPLGIATAGTLALVLATLAWAHAIFPIRADSWTQIEVIRARGAQLGIEVHRVYDRWNATGRIEYFADTPTGGAPARFRFFTQDATAGAVAVAWDGRDEDEVPVGHSDVASMCQETLYGEAYYTHRERVIVIGVGAGADVQCALYHRADLVEAVEINPDAIAAIRGPMNDFLGGIGLDERVRYHVRDGRSFLRSVPPESYDLIQLSGVDTKHLLASGALALSENHIYTLEALADYLEALRPGGVIALIRFGEPEVLRLVHTAVTVLAEAGVATPEQHLVVIRNGEAFGVLIQREPFSPSELRRIRTRFLSLDRVAFEGLDVWFLDAIGLRASERPQVVYQPGSPAQEPFSSYFAAVRKGTVDAFLVAAPSVMTPVTDDRPFFFDTARPGDPARSAGVLTPLWIAVVVLALLLIVAPLAGMADRLRGRAAVVFPAYFAAVGLAYLLVEIWALHRFSLLLGHRTLALVVVLAGLLIASGVGAWLSERLVASPRQRALGGIAAALGVLVASAAFSGPLADWTQADTLTARAAVVLLLVVPAGLAMGLPFPAGLQLVARRSNHVLPWCVGINAFASVVASVAALPLALAHGYSLVLWLALGFYALAAALLFCWRQPS